MLAELTRISDHLSSLAAQASEAGANSSYHLLLRQQDAVGELFAAVEGRRWSSGLTRIGGLAADLPEDFELRLASALKEMKDALTQVERHMMRSRIWRRRLEGRGALSAAEAVSWGVSGPALRATGVERDIRRADPYLVYEELDFEIPVGSAGDVVDRFHVRLSEIEQSCAIVGQAIARLPDGEFRLEDHKVSVPPKERLNDMETLIHHFELLMDGHGLRPPTGAEVYAPTESANGELGFFLVSDGTGPTVPMPPASAIALSRPDPGQADSWHHHCHRPQRGRQHEHRCGGDGPMMNDASHRFGDPSDRLGHGDSPPGPFNERTMEICEEIIGRYPSPAGALVPVLLLFQEEVGCCSTEVVEYTARLLGLRPARVQGVVTFYPMLRSVSSDGRCVRVWFGDFPASSWEQTMSGLI